MFTGIIQGMGTVEKVSDNENIKILTIKTPHSLSPEKIGESIAVDGACLTVISIVADTFSVECIPETIKKTVVKNYNTNTVVNLENPLKLDQGIDGHLVQGHVDFIGTIKKIFNQGESKILTISFPGSMGKFFANKGSVTVNGVSLTISKLNTDTFEVSLIPQTLKSTNLGKIQENSQVNIEIDLIARYLDRLLQDRAQQINYEFLVERGFI